MFRLFFPALVVFFLFNYWVSYHLKPIEPNKKVYLLPPEYLEHFTLGYNDAMADSFWLRWIQDIDVCGKETIPRAEFDLKLKAINASQAAEGITPNKSSNQGLVKALQTHAYPDVCEKGWAFRLLETITTLAPKFRMPYSIGAPALSVFVNDHLGAKEIFDRGVANFPDDWSILYRAAYHYLYELKDLKAAADLLTRAGDLGAPFWVKSLASRLYSKSGQVLLGIVTLEGYAKQLKEGEYKEKVLQRVQELRKVLESQKSR